MAQTVQMDVEFKVTDREHRPLAGRPVRLVLGEKNYPDPQSGHRFVTDAKGEARFTTPAVLERQTTSTNFGITPIRIPRRVDYLAIGVELEHVVPMDGQQVTVHWLYGMDIKRFANGQCSSYGIMKIFDRDAQGRFTKLGVLKNQDGWRDGGYRAAFWRLDPPEAEAEPPRPRWNLLLEFVETP